jgi:hypothetical protein
MKYRKKPIVVEAFQMTKERRWDNSEWPNWLNAAWNEDRGVGMWCDAEKPNDTLYLGTLEGVYAVLWNDWIIRGVAKELYPCKPSIFDLTYEMVGDGNE